MPICPVCGGNIAATDTNCPYCGKTQLHLGDAPRDTSEWDLPMDDNPSLIAAPPAPWVPAPTPASPSPGEDWLLPEAILEPPPPADVSLPPWARIPAPEPVTRQPTTFDFVFDLDSPGPAAAPEGPPAPVISPVLVTPIPVTPVPVTPIPVTPVAARLPPPVIAVPPPAPPAPARPSASTPVGRGCPSCGKTFGPEYNDSFCLCGAELKDAPPALAPAPPPAPPAPAKRPAPQRPPAGTRCLVLYGADKQPVSYFALSKDATLVGRLDAAGGCFPEIDVSEHVDEATARKVSRKHVLILRSRSSDGFTLRALPGNTGTQVEKLMLSGPEDVPLTPGTRIVLGGAVRLKFEVM